MRIKLSIVSEKSAGVLAAIIAVLRKAKIDFDNQHIEDIGKYRKLDVYIEASKPEVISLRGSIVAVEGVRRFKAYVARPASKDESPAGAKPRDDFNTAAVAARISNAFPDIFEIITTQQMELEKNDATEQLFKVGQKVAKLRADALPPIEDEASLAYIMRMRVIPDLDELATAEYAEEGYETGLKIMVSDFTDPSKSELKSSIYTFGSLEAETIKCDFLTGYIQGILALSDETQNVQVSETHCRNEGHPYCLFEFT